MRLPRLHRRRGPARSDAFPDPVYRLRSGPDGVAHFLARGDHPRVTQAFLDMIRSLSGRPGVVWVEYAERPEEWAASEVALSTLLAAMVSVRDLLGREAMDMAVYSRNEGVEVFLDHLGELEVRSGSWNESRFRAVLERVGFRCAEDIFLPGTAEAVREPLDPAWRTRLAEARDMLGLAPVGPRKAVGP